MRRPRVVEKIRQRDRCGNFMVEDDGIAEFPDAQAEKKSKRERVKFRRDFAFRFHAPSLCLQPVQKAIYGDQAQLPVLRFWRLCWPVQLLVLALWPAFAKRTSVKRKFIVVLLLALSIVIMALLFFYREIPRGPEQAGEGRPCKSFSSTGACSLRAARATEGSTTCPKGFFPPRCSPKGSGRPTRPRGGWRSSACASTAWSRSGARSWPSSRTWFRPLP